MTLVAEPPATVALPLETETYAPTKGHTMAKLIRAGMRLRPYQAFGRAFYGSDSACVLGALYVGLKGHAAVRGSLADMLYFDIGVDPEQLVTHPVTGEQHGLYTVIVTLNDTQRWTREAIACWIETLDLESVP